VALADGLVVEVAEADEVKLFVAVPVELAVTDGVIVADFVAERLVDEEDDKLIEAEEVRLAV